MQIMSYSGYEGVDNYRSMNGLADVEKAPAYIQSKPSYKALDAKDQRIVDILWNRPLSEIVAARLASIKGEAWGSLKADEVKARNNGFREALLLKVADMKAYVDMGPRNKMLALWLLTAYEPRVRDAYFAVQNGTKYETPGTDPAGLKSTQPVYAADDFAKNLKWAVDFAVKARFPQGISTGTAAAVNNANQAKQAAAAATNTAQNVAANSGNAAAKKAADEAAAEKKRADAAAAEAAKQAAAAKAANDRATAEAAKAAAAIAAANKKAEESAKAAAESAQKAKDEADRKAADAAAVAQQAAAAAEAKAAEAIAVSQSREADLLAQQAEAEEKKKKNRNIAMAVGGVAVVGALVWFARRNK